MRTDGRSNMRGSYCFPYLNTCQYAKLAVKIPLFLQKIPLAMLCNCNDACQKKKPDTNTQKVSW